MRRPSPLAVGLIAAILALGWQYLTVRYNYQGNWSALFCTGEATPLPPSLEEGTYRFARSPGYDGMYYHLIAHDPLFRKGFSSYVDNPRLRWRRILVPGLANAIAGGRDARVDFAYIAVTIASVFFGAFWLSRYCTLYGFHSVWGLFFLAVPAVPVSIDRQTVDAALAALGIGFIRYYGRSPLKALPLLCLLPLARETGLCLTAGTVLWELKRRDWRRLAMAAASSVPFLAWAAFVHAHTMRDGTPWLSVPFGGLIARTLNPLPYELTGRWVATAAILDYLAVLGVWLALAFVAYLAFRRPLGVLEYCLVAFGLAVIWLGKADIWGGAYEFGRTMSPMLFLLMMLAISARQRRYLIPMAMVLPRIALQYQPQLFGIMAGLLGR